MNNHLTRRNFLATTSAAVPAALLGRSVFPHDTAQPSAAFVRRDIGNLLETDQVIVSYRKAIAAMQALPYTNPCSWTYQAAIHATTLTDNLTAWNTCEHGSIFFWSWHRMYLYWFEKIIRKMSNDSSWALPYWNYSYLPERQLPPMFRDSTGAPELYVAARGSGWNNGTAAFPASDVDYSAGFAYGAFYSAQSQIEFVPHDLVHVDIGGWMGNISTAAQDPIFYLHHANIDRLWDQWLAQGGRSDPVADATWTGKVFTFFDDNCSKVTMSACEILRAAQQLNYMYENECNQVNDYCYVCYLCWWNVYCCIEFLELPPINLGSETVTVPIGVLDDQYWQAIQRHEFATLQLNNVQALHQPGASWEVYVGLPSGAEPYPESQYYVGSVVLFAVGIHDQGHHGEFHPANFNLVINHAVLGTQRGAPLTLTFVPHGPLINGRPSRPEVRALVNIGSVSLAIGKEQQVPPNVGPPTHH
jgi:tyrosinase